MRCPTCLGTGLVDGPFVGSLRPDCARCNGRGTVPPDVPEEALEPEGAEYRLADDPAVSPPIDDPLWGYDPAEGY